MDSSDITGGVSSGMPIDPALREREDNNGLMAETSSEQNRTSTTPSHSVTPQKRNRESLGPKNIQACDRCRTKKTKCLPRDNTRNLCQACFGAGLTCTFDLPLTASRTKRVRKGLIGSQYGDGHDETAVGLGLLAAVLPESGGSCKRLRRRVQHLVSRAGSTSLEYILHSAPSLPLFVLEDWDHARGVSIHHKEGQAGHVHITRHDNDDVSDMRAIAATTNALTWRRTVDGLVRDYVAKLAPLFPIIHQEDLADDDELLYHAAALAAATSRSCPSDIFNALRHIVNEAVKAEDVNVLPTRRNVQVLLLLCLSDDTVPPDTAASVPIAIRHRLLCAQQMLRDLEASEPRHTTDVLWAWTVMLDLWHSIRSGTRQVCDKREMANRLSPHAHFESFFGRFCSLSLLLHRTVITIYGEDGLSNIEDGELEAIRDDLRQWRDNLPDSLRLTSLTSSIPAGLLHLLHVTVLCLLYRPFMRWSFTVDAPLTFNLDLRVWSELHSASQSGLEWVSNLSDVADLQCWGGYIIGLSSFVQYHHWARRRDGGGVIMLEKVRDSARGWAADGKLAELRKELDVIEVLYEATGKLSGSRPEDLPTFERGLHPTAGSYNRPR